MTAAADDHAAQRGDVAEVPPPADDDVIGAHADRGVPSGGGSSQVIPRGGVAAKEQIDGDRAMIFDPGSPVDTIRRQFPRASVDFNDGSEPVRAAKAAAKAETAIRLEDDNQERAAVEEWRRLFSWRMPRP